jgi:cell division septation protein DedD
MLDQRGGIISKIFIIPAGVVVIIGAFSLGYYMGRDQGRKTASNEKPAALPEVVSQYLPKKEEFTFYKTLTEKGEKTVSIDLKPKQRPEESAPSKKENAVPSSESKPKQPETAKASEARAEKTAAKPAVQQTAKAQHPPAPAPKEPAVEKQTLPSKVRYTIQVGSYPEKAMAEEETKNMKKRGYAAFLVASEIPEKGKWYRVRVGSFANKQSAEKLAKELKSKEGIDGFITME